MIETSNVLWIAPCKATSRDQEIQHGAKNLPPVVQLEQHTLNLASQDSNFEADCISTIQLQWCLQRGALALGQVRLSSWDCQNKWINQLLTTPNTPPPPGHSRLSLEQVIKADKQLWTELAKCFTEAVVAAVGLADLPFDQHVSRLRNEPRVTIFLLPLPLRSKESKPSIAAPSQPSTGGAKAAAKGQPKKKFKASKKAERSKPDALSNMETVTKDGQNICWSFKFGVWMSGSFDSGIRRSVAPTLTGSSRGPRRAWYDILSEFV